MKKKIYHLLILTVILLFCNGCLAQALYLGAYAIEGAKLATALIPHDENSSSEKQPDLILEKELGRHQINQFEIKINDASYKNTPVVNFAAYENGKNVKGVAFPKNDPRIIDRYRSCQSETEKQEFLRELFLTQNFDLGPITKTVEPIKEQEKAKAESAPSSVSSGAMPVTN